MSERKFICKNCGLGVVDLRQPYEYTADWRHTYSLSASCYEKPIAIPVEVSGAALEGEGA